MNGRIYDPTLGRFLQADPHIQAPANSQNYNRYSYVLNNPLSYTDPSGYFFTKLNKMFGKFAPFVSIAAMMFIPGAWGFATESILGAVTTGFFAGGIATGSLKGAVTGAFAAAAFYGIGQHFRGLSNYNNCNVVDESLYSFGGNTLSSGQIAGQIASHAAVGGVTSVLSGGKFGHGFFSAGVTKGLGGKYLPGGSNLSRQEIAGGTVVSAVIGGTASVISGGKFENGARTAAYQYLFNQASSIKKLISPTGGVTRFDSAGDGTWNAPRGKRKHKGLDLTSTKGQNVVSPVDGTVVSFTGATTGYPIVDITPSDPSLGIDKIRLLYVDASAGSQPWTSSNVTAGDVIGTSSDLQMITNPATGQAYSLSVTPHVHVQIQVGGSWVDPTPYF